MKINNCEMLLRSEPFGDVTCRPLAAHTEIPQKRAPN